MPIINVREQDKSWYYAQRSANFLNVFAFGFTTFGPETPTFVDSDSFTSIFGNAIPGMDNTQYEIVKSYLADGANVLFQRLTLTGASKANKAITKTESTTTTDSNLTVKAKYVGSFGKKLSVKFTEPETVDGKVVGYIKVFYTENDKTTPELVETISVYDYNTLDYTSNYIEMEIATEETFDADGIDSLATYKLDQGGLDYTTGGDIQTLVKTALRAFINNTSSDLVDPLLYTIDVITANGFDGHLKNKDSSPDDPPDNTLDLKLAEIAKTRGDCIYLIDGVSTVYNAETPDEFYEYCTNAGFIDNPKTTLLSSHCVAIGPWTRSTLVSNGKTTKLPGSYSFVTEWCNSINRGNPDWLTPAGVKRASISTTIDTVVPVGRVVLDDWQGNDKDYKVNPIMRLKQYGFTIYGNSTLLPNKADGSTSMLQQISVRALANKIKQRAFDISLSLQFDQMTSQVLLEFKTLLSTYMDELRYQGGLYDYEIIVGTNGVFTITDLNTKTVPVIIRISPTPAVENFDITLEVNQAGITFGEEV